MVRQACKQHFVITIQRYFMSHLLDYLRHWWCHIVDAVR